MRYKLIKDHDVNLREVYIVKVKGTFKWHTVKTFSDEDEGYALRCAEELLDILKSTI